jgi:2-phospho-L-lactate guanylyltransferase
VKPLIRAKSRLADVLTPKERENLSIQVLSRTLKLLVSTKAVTDVLVISRDTQVLSLARGLNIHTVQESGQPELNDALVRATKLLQTWGVEAVLILPADLPLIQAQDIEAIVELGRFNGSIVVAPDEAEDGTNALLVHPPGLIDYSYGNGSYHRHVATAKANRAIVHIYESERIQLDLDTPADLVRYNQLAAKLGEPALDFTKPHRGETMSVVDDLIPNGGTNG